MKKQLKLSRSFFGELSRMLKLSGSWMRVVKDTRAAMGYLLRVPLLLLGKFRPTDSLACLVFSKLVLDLWRGSGAKGTSAYLKVAQIAFMAYLSGSRIDPGSFSPRISLTRSGIPSCIPSAHRKVLRNRSDGWHHLARLWLSLFGLFRVIPFKGRMKISTITAPGPAYPVDMFAKWVNDFVGFFPVESDYVWKPMLIDKSAPGTGKKSFATSTSALDYHASVLLHDHPKLFGALMVVAGYLGGGKAIDWLRCADTYPDSTFPRSLGRLGTKEEPGKVRVFAMVDWWTQTILSPLHHAIISSLSVYKMDGTMDQDKAVQTARSLLSVSGWGASYDLTAATDRLPVSLQAMLLDRLHPGLGDAWQYLLVHRSYSIGPRRSVRYAVGQPMGALSSWAMLAYTHHFLVQVSAWRVGYQGIFKNYVILGDDITIFDRRVASQYLHVMKVLGIQINLAKSIVSSDSFEFAKRFCSRGFDLSPVSFRELDVAGASLDALQHLLSKFTGKVSLNVLIRLRGIGYRTRSRLHAPFSSLPRRLSVILVWATMPGSTGLGWFTWIDWICSTSVLKCDRSLLSLDSLRDRLSAHYDLLFKRTTVYSESGEVNPPSPDWEAGSRPYANGWTHSVGPVTSLDGSAIDSSQSVSGLTSAFDTRDLLIGFLRNSGWASSYEAPVLPQTPDSKGFVASVLVSRADSFRILGLTPSQAAILSPEISRISDSYRICEKSLDQVSSLLGRSIRSPECFELAMNKLMTIEYELSSLRSISDVRVRRDPCPHLMAGRWLTLWSRFRPAAKLSVRSR